MRYGTPVAKSSPGASAVTRIGLAVWIACLGFAQSASAEVSISGQANALKLETRGATLDEVLRALRLTYKFQYKGTGALPDVISGTYSGSLRSVVARLLNGHDYIMRGSPDDLSVEILAPKNAPAAGRAVMTAPSAPGTAASLPQPGTEPVKDCLYKDGDKVIPVEC
jgi:hypothetical protein